MTDPTALRARLHAVAHAFLELRPAVMAASPWPLAAEFGPGPEASWGPPEVLAHVTEMLPYWLGVDRARLAAAPRPAPFGRVASDPVRIAIIGRDRTVPLRELFDRVEADAARYERRLAGLTTTDLARTGLHPMRGMMTVGEALERFVVDHFAEHTAQLQVLLATAR